MKQKVILITNIKDKTDFIFKLNKSNPHQETYIFILLKSKQDLTLTTKTLHQISNSSSKTIIRALVATVSNLKIQSLVKISSKYQNCSAILDQQVLLVSPSASAQTLPYLEVSSQTAKATHASKIFHLDQNQLLYLQSRGFSKQKATQLLTRAFFDQVLILLTDFQKRDKIYQSINKYI
jgi:Fe-S cluster assembly scaffold protein SufB